MRIIVAPDSYKGSVSALGVAQAIERGIHAVFPDAQVQKVPIADGGEGGFEYRLKWAEMDFAWRWRRKVASRTHSE